MSRLVLVFDLTESRLSRTEFRFDDGAPPLISLRGRCAVGFPGATGEFQWSPAVRALTLLLVRYHLHGTGALSDLEPYLAGVAGSLASSLDYALSKQPSWLCEMFGASSGGEALARLLIRRINPERKKGGAVTLFMNPKRLSPHDIKLFSDEGVLLTTADGQAILASLAEDPPSISTNRPGLTVLESNAPANVELSPPLSLPTSAPSERIAVDCNDTLGDPHLVARSLLEQWIGEELSSSIFASDIFTNHQAKALLRHMAIDPVIQFFLGERVDALPAFFAHEGIPLAPSARQVESLLNQMNAPRSMRLVTTVGQIPTIALCEVIREKFGFNITTDLEAPHTPALLKDLRTAPQSEHIEVISLALGATVSALRGGSAEVLEPLSAVPGGSYMLLRSPTQSASPKLKGELHLLPEELSTSSIYWQHVQRAKVLSLRNLTIVPTEPAEALARMQEGTEASMALSWFPHYRVQELLTKSSRLVDLRQRFGISEAYWFCRPLAPAVSAALRSAVRYAWIELRINPTLRRTIVRRIAHDDAYFCAFLRLTGLHSQLPRLAERELVLPKAI